jgi:hypothetical protein
MRVFARKSVAWNSRSVVVALLAAAAAVIVVPQAGRAQEGATYGLPGQDLRRSASSRRVWLRCRWGGALPSGWVL